MRVENDNRLAKIEHEGVDAKGYFHGTVCLNQNNTEEGIWTSYLTGMRIHVAGEEESPFDDYEDEEEFGDLVSYQGEDEEEEDYDEEEEAEPRLQLPARAPARTETRTTVIDLPGEELLLAKRQKTADGSASQPIDLLSLP